MKADKIYNKIGSIYVSCISSRFRVIDPTILVLYNKDFQKTVKARTPLLTMDYVFWVTVTTIPP